MHISFFCCIFVVEIRITTKTLTTMATTIKNATLYNDYNYNVVEDYRDAYLDHCDELGINVEDEIPMEFIQDMLDADWFALFDNLDSNIYNDECVVIGSLGLWHGRQEINPTREDTLAEAIRQCCNNCDYSHIKIVDGHVEVTSAHHDGTNYFKIYLLNKRGRNTIQADLTKSCYHRKIKNDFWG